MSYPNFEDKHLREALFHPSDFLKYKKFSKTDLPEDYILIYDHGLFSRVRKKYDLKDLNLPFVHTYAYTYNGVGLVRSMGIGSPHAAMIFETLVSIGGKRFLNLGTAGGLQKEGFFLCERAIRDEGTSSHYAAHEKYSYPDKSLTDKLGNSMSGIGIDFERSTDWTIDAIYRETKSEIDRYRKEGVATVDMEASALFAIAKCRKVKIAAAFVVSDVLGEKWDPRFHTVNLKKGLDQLIEAGFDCLKR